MKLISKVNVSDIAKSMQYKIDMIGTFSEFPILIQNNIYEAELCPVIHDPVTLKPDEPSYVVICEDSKMRKFYADNFYTLDEVREIRINYYLEL